MCTTNEPITSNVMKMREALLKTQSTITKCMDILNEIPEECGYDGLIEDVADELCDLHDEYVKDAFASLPRNCDVGTTEEQIARFNAECLAIRNRNTVEPCAGCLRSRGGEGTEDCQLYWAQAPYATGDTK